MNKLIHPTKEPTSSFAPPEADLDSADQAGYPAASAQKLEEIQPEAPAPGPGSLISITKILYELEEALIDQSGELTPELEAKFSAATIAQEKKVDAYGIVIDRLESLSLEYAKRAQRLLSVSKGATNIVNNLWSNIKYAMRLLEVKELQGNEIRFSLSTGKKVDVFDPALLPEGYLREVIKYEPNLVAIGTALKAGTEVPGARLTDSYTLRTSAPKRGLK